MNPPLLQVRNLSVKLPVRSSPGFRGRKVSVVHQASLTVKKQETFCVIGESGSGKTSLLLAILGFHPFCKGDLVFEASVIKRSNDRVHRMLQHQSQMVFQDPQTSLNPLFTLEKSLEEPLRANRISKGERKAVINRLARETGLSKELLGRRPSRVSGGECQRAAIARAMSTMPKILFLDEPLTALDALTGKQVTGLLVNMKKEYALTMILVSHDLGLVRDIGTGVGVMYFGRFVEIAPVKEFFSNPLHPYSRALLSCTLTPGLWSKQRIILQGEMPSPQRPPSGCVFHPRCSMVMPCCRNSDPPPMLVDQEHEVCCHLYANVGGKRLKK